MDINRVPGRLILWVQIFSILWCHLFWSFWSLCHQLCVYSLQAASNGVRDVIPHTVCTNGSSDKMIAVVLQYVNLDGWVCSNLSLCLAVICLYQSSDAEFVSWYAEPGPLQASFLGTLSGTNGKEALHVVCALLIMHTAFTSVAYAFSPGMMVQQRYNYKY